MTEIREAFAHLADLDASALHVRRAELLEASNGDFQTMTDEALAELYQIGRLLRRKVVFSGGGRKKVTKEKKSTTLEDLA